MEGVLEGAAVLCVCKQACSLLFLPLVPGSLSPVTFCCCCLLIFTDFIVTACLVSLWLAASWLPQLSLSSDVIALRFLLFLSRAYEGVLLLTTPLIAVETVLRLQWPQDDVSREVNEEGPKDVLSLCSVVLETEDEDEDRDRAKGWSCYHAVGYLCCLSVWVLSGLRGGFGLEERWAAACIHNTHSLVACLPTLLTGIMPDTMEPCWGLAVVCLLVLLTVSMGLHRRHLATTQTDRHLAATQTDRHLAATQTDRHLAATQTDRHLAATQTDRHLAATQTDRHLATTQTDRHLAATQTDRHLAATQTDRHLAATQTDRHLATTQTDRHLAATQTDRHLATTQTDRHLAATQTDRHLALTQTDPSTGTHRERHSVGNGGGQAPVLTQAVPSKATDPGTSPSQSVVDPQTTGNSCPVHRWCSWNGVQMSPHHHGDIGLPSLELSSVGRGGQEHKGTKRGVPLAYITEEDTEPPCRSRQCGWRRWGFPCLRVNVMTGLVGVLCVCVLPLNLSVNILLIQTIEIVLELGFKSFPSPQQRQERGLTLNT